jgi:hypothetical protein
VFQGLVSLRSTVQNFVNEVRTSGILIQTENKNAELGSHKQSVGCQEFGLSINFKYLKLFAQDTGTLPEGENHIEVIETISL